MNRSTRGSILGTVMVVVLLAGVLAASVATLISFQRRSGVRQQLKLHAMNAAEAAIDHAYAYIISDAEANGLDKSNYIPPYGSAAKKFTFGTDALKFLQTQNTRPSTTGSAGDPIRFGNLDVRVMPRPATSTRVYKDPKDPANTYDPNRGQWVYQETIPVVAAATATQAGITYTAYARKDINYNITNLFQHSIFYQGQLHLHRGFKVMGSAHTNGNLILNAHTGDKAVYNGFVTAGNRFYRGSITDSGGSGMDAFGLVPQLSNGDLDPAKFKTGATGDGDGTSSTPGDGDLPIFIETDPKTGKHMYRFVNRTTDSRMTNWKDEATSKFLGHLQDKSHAVAVINPIGSLGYAQDVSSTKDVNEFSNGPYFLIEPLLPAKHAARKSNYRYNLSANASLVLRVEYAARDMDGVEIKTLYDPNTYESSKPASGYVSMSGKTPVQQALNPSNYIVRAYKMTKTRADDPTADRTAIPFPTDVIGRADYDRSENTGSRAYAAGTAPQLIDVLGTEAGITTATSPRSNTSPLTAINQQDKDESWHRYRVETYWASTVTNNYNTAADLNPKTKSYTPLEDTILKHIGTPKQARGVPGAISTTAKNVYARYGLHDSRLGRGAHLLTLDIGRLKEIMEAPLVDVKSRFGEEAYRFRSNFNNGVSEWNGIIYVEFPTSTIVDTSTINPAPSTSVYANNAKEPWNPTRTADTGKSYLDTYLFKYGDAEKRHPLRTGDTSDVKDRTDKIVPIAPELRQYPTTVDSQTITDPANAIIALQVINANKLPKLNVTKFDANKNNTLNAGFTLATNAPVYLIGSWNADGNYTTGTNVTSTNPNDYATVDDPTLSADNNPEIPSALFCDSLTVLSPGWATQTDYPLPSGSTVPSGTTRRQNSFKGWTDATNNSEGNRQVTWKNASERIEISACIATGEFPVFEFFTHALEDFNLTNGKPCTPLVVKGAMVAMFTSEIQHIKQAYGRSASSDIQVYWQGHGAHCFPSPRLHKFIIDGNFPPGTPQALVPSQSNFQILLPGDELIKNAGF